MIAKIIKTVYIKNTSIFITLNPPLCFLYQQFPEEPRARITISISHSLPNSVVICSYLGWCVFFPKKFCWQFSGAVRRAAAPASSPKQPHRVNCLINLMPRRFRRLKNNQGYCDVGERGDFEWLICFTIVDKFLDQKNIL